MKKLDKRTKWVLSISFLFLISLAIYSFIDEHGQTYTLPKVSINKNPERVIETYLGNEFEWLLHTPDRVSIYVREIGQGETIVTLHGGFGMSHDYLRHFMKPFEDQFHIVYYDQRGSLRSPVPDYNFEKYITLENMVNDLELLRRALKVNKLKLVAHSMGAVLAYEYMKKFPDRVGDIIIISGFGPKFPDSNAAFNDLFTSQKERESFSNRSTVKSELQSLKGSIDTTYAEYIYLRYKIRSSSLQIYDIKKWVNTSGGLGFYNPKINEIIGPESNISLIFLFKFFMKERQFKKGTLDTTDISRFNTPINYLPIIENHTGKIDYILGTHEVGDWNLRLYKRYIRQTDKVKMHIFKNAGHNMWIDKPIEFHKKLSQLLQSK